MEITKMKHKSIKMEDPVGGLSNDSLKAGSQPVSSLKLSELSNDSAKVESPPVSPSKSPPYRKTSIARSMSVPNNSANSDVELIQLSPKQEEAIPSVTISDFSSHELTSIHKGLSRHNSLPKTINKVRFCCPTHSRQKPSLSPALSMSDLSNHEEFSDAEPETP